MNGRVKLPIKEWKTEQSALTAERFLLCEDYYRLKDEVRNVEVLRKGVDDILSEERSERQRIKAHDLDL